MVFFKILQIARAVNLFFEIDFLGQVLNQRPKRHKYIIMAGVEIGLLKKK